MFSPYRPHPWHGLSAGQNAPRIVNAFVEITPFDGIKYEIDKHSGYLTADRPQQTSSLPPAAYGFIPQTYCGAEIAALSGCEKGDGDPLDICILSERPLTKSEVILRAKVLGGFRQIDRGEADDKIVAVLENDLLWGEAETLHDLPQPLIQRLRHYFATYKLKPDGNPTLVQESYDAQTAYAVIRAAQNDYLTLNQS